MVSGDQHPAGVLPGTYWILRRAVETAPWLRYRGASTAAAGSQGRGPDLCGNHHRPDQRAVAARCPGKRGRARGALSQTGAVRCRGRFALPDRTFTAHTTNRRGALIMIELDPRISALVLIDLQQGILSNALTPVSSQELLVRGQALAERFRAAKATVVLVNVAFSADGGDVLRQPVDQAPPLPAGGFPASWSEFPPGLMQPGDLRITKRQWGAF